MTRAFLVVHIVVVGCAGAGPAGATAVDPSSCVDPNTREKDEQVRATDNKAHEPVSSRLPPEQIQSIVRSKYDGIRSCYERGLANNPNLRGIVTIRFVIERDGSVGKARISDNTLPDCRVAQCIREEYPYMKFPPPDGGIVTVVYPIMLEPG